MEHPDWNWFFSTGAQMFVTLVVGLGIAIAVPLWNAIQRKADRLRGRAGKLLEEVYAIRDKIEEIDLPSHVRCMRRLAIRQLHDQGRNPFAVHSDRMPIYALPSLYGFSRYDDPQQVMETLMELQKVPESPVRRKPLRLVADILLWPLARKFQHTRKKDLAFWLAWERERVDPLYREVPELEALKPYQNLESFSPYFRNPEKWKDL